MSLTSYVHHQEDYILRTRSLIRYVFHAGTQAVYQVKDVLLTN